MRRLILLITMISSLTAVSAQKYLSKTGHIWFYSHTPMEDIEAHNRQVVSMLNTSTGEVSFNLLIKSFIFKNALMQEHFNENYMESDKIPKAAFKGNLQQTGNINWSTDGNYTCEVSGNITIHGVTRPLKTSVTFEIKNNIITGKAKFELNPKDFEIIIPSLVESKIAKVMEISVEIPYSPI